MDGAHYMVIPSRSVGLVQIRRGLRPLAGSPGRALVLEVAGSPGLALILDVGCTPGCLLLRSVATLALAIAVLFLSLALAVAAVASERARRRDKLRVGLGFLAFILLWHSSSCPSKSMSPRRCARSSSFFSFKLCLC